jgi:hypothetical protein
VRKKFVAFGWGSFFIFLGIVMLLSAHTAGCGDGENHPRWQKPIVTERWSEGGVKQARQLLSSGGGARSRVCYTDIDGRVLGCGLFQDDKPWTGLFVEWFEHHEHGTGGQVSDSHHHGKPGHPRLIRSYREGKRHGVWVIFWETGEPQNVLRYEFGKLVHRSIHSPEGRLITEESY